VLVALLLVAAGALPSQAQLEGAALEAIVGSCGERKASIDRDLTRACRSYTAAAAAGRASVNGPAVSFYASIESAEPAPVAGIGTVDPPSHADRAVGDLFPKSCHFNRIGVGAAVLPSGGAVVCALTALHGTDLDRITGRVDAGETVHVRGTLAPGLVSPRLYVTRPSGEVDELKLGNDGRSFATALTLETRGEHSIEVLADGAGGPQVAALRRVFVGVPVPTRPPPEPRDGEGLAGVEAAIARLRASHGLPPVQRDRELDASAEGHSHEMARLRTFAHVLPSDGTTGERLRARGYPYRSVGENIGLANDVGSAHEAIVGSPAHLANLLDPRHRRLGLGAVKGLTPDGTEAFYLTEVLVAPVVGSVDPAGEIAGYLAAERQRRGLRALRRDQTLDAVAAEQVRAMASSDQMKLTKAVPAAAAARAKGLSSVVAELHVSTAPEDLTSSKNLAEPRWTRIGVGALYASSKEYGPSRLWVVLLYGR